MIRDTSRLSGQRFDVLVIGGGIHGLTIAWDAALRGLSVALVERGDLGSGSSFNHAKTVHGGLRSLQTGDVVKARFSMRERRAMARIAPNFVTPLCFMMATTRKITRSRLALTAGFALDALIGFDRNAGVVPGLHLPAGRVVGCAAYREAFGANASALATGGARWCDYHMPESDRLTFAFARAASDAGAVLATYVEAVAPRRAASTITGVEARDVLTGLPIDIDARCVVNAAGAYSPRWMASLGGDPAIPLLKATNIVTARTAGAMGLGAPTADGRLLLIMPWQGRALVGTSHSEAPVEADDQGVSTGELDAFIAEVNSAFPALALTAADVTLVHRGVVPGERQREGRFGLMAHHRIRDHARDGIAGAVSVAGVKYTTARGVAEQVVDLVCEKLGVGRRPCRTGSTLLPGAFTHEAEREVAQLRQAGADVLDPAIAPSLVRLYGSSWHDVLDLCHTRPEWAAAIAPGCPLPAAVLAHAVMREVAVTLTDAVVRRTGIGAAGYPGEDVAWACAGVLASLLAWDSERTAREVAALQAFYQPIAPGAGSASPVPGYC